MPTRSEQLSHLLVPLQKASLAATNPVGTGFDPTNKSAVASGSCIAKVLDALHFHQSHYRDFKAYYIQHVLPHLCPDFPGLVSYSRFVRLIPSVLVPLAAYLDTCRGQCNGLSFVDSTKLAVYHNRRLQQQRVFAVLAERGNNSVDWFYGFKRQVVVTDEGNLLACRLTPGNGDDRNDQRSDQEHFPN